MSWASGAALGHFFQQHACDTPERKPDERSLFHQGGCRGCTISLRAAITIEPLTGEFDGWWRHRDTLAPLVTKWETQLDAKKSSDRS